MAEKATLIATGVINPDEMEAFEYYTSHASVLLKEGGGEVIGKYKVVQHLIGEEPLSAFLVMEFPDDPSIIGVFESEEYKKLIPSRDKAFKKLDVFIAH
ncbi:MAG TPA: DUF1330 domain-containing protein [Spirochaetes bacterium]|nr:DUF1330 domain-containing protein [Spirochaetota bacterium]